MRGAQISAKLTYGLNRCAEISLQAVGDGTLAWLGRSEPNRIIALYLIKEMILCVLDFRHIYNLMLSGPAEPRKRRRSLRI